MKEIKKLFKYFKGNLKLIVLSIFYALIFVISMLLIPYYIGLAIDNIIAVEGKNAFFNYLIIIACLIVCAVVFEYLFESTLSIFTERVMKKFKDDIYKKINLVSIKFIDTHNKGDLLSRTINDVDNVYNAIISSFKQLFQGVITLITTIVIMFYMNYILALVVLFLTPLALLISYFVASRSSKYFKEQGTLNGQVGAIVLEDLTNFETIKAFNYSEESFKKFETVNNYLYKVGQKSQFISSLTNPSSRLINNGTYAIVGILGAILVVSGSSIGGALTIGGISAFLQYANQFAKPVNEISSCVSELQLGYVSLKRINEILEANNDIDEGKKLLKKPIKNINFDHIYFNYVEGQKLIEDFNFTINKGEKIAIVGPTGAGKTTMVNLLMRFYDPTKGSFLFDGTNSLFVPKKDLRSNFKMVLQETWIFKGTVRDNITYGKKDVSEKELIEACKEANSYDFITRLPNGFETVISDNSGLSIGEKQLINITRVMLNKPDIVILDEMTSNIDTRTEIKILDGFSKLMKNRTSIVIAHRLSTIVNSDKIIVMKDGHIIEVGSHEELLSKKGFYYELYNSQFEQ